MLEGISFADDAQAAAAGADAVVIVTEWDEFRALDLEQMAGSMRGKTLVDLRNVYDRAEAAAGGPHLFRHRPRAHVSCLEHPFRRKLHPKRLTRV